MYNIQTPQNNTISNRLHIQTWIEIGYYHLIPTSNYIHIQTTVLELKAIFISTQLWYFSTNAIPPNEV